MNSSSNGNRFGIQKLEAHDVGNVDEHPLAIVNGVSMMDSQEMIELDVARLHSGQLNGPQEENALRQILVNWVKRNGVGYKQGMHEICLVLYLENDKDVDECYKRFDNVMKWLYPLFYRDSGVNEWIKNDFSPMLRKMSPRRLYEIIVVKFQISHAVRCIRWCRLLFIRELSGPDQYLPIWYELFDIENKGKFIACVTIVMLMCIVPQLTEAQDESECLYLLLNYPKLCVPIEKVVGWAKIMYDYRAVNTIDSQHADSDADANASPLEEEILQGSNGEWYKKYKDYDVNRLRKEMRLKRRAKWRLSK